MRDTVLAVMVMCAVVVPGFAKPKEKTFATTCDRVWIALKRVATPPHYNFSDLDESQKKGIISTGNFATGKRFLDITLLPSAGGCTVAIGGSFSGIAHNDKGDLFKRIEEALVDIPEHPEGSGTGRRSKGVSTSALTNADVLRLKTAGLSDTVIIEKIGASPADYRLGTEDLIDLEHEGLSDSVIRAMIEASQR